MAGTSGAEAADTLNGRTSFSNARYSACTCTQMHGGKHGGRCVRCPAERLLVHNCATRQTRHCTGTAVAAESVLAMSRTKTEIVKYMTHAIQGIESKARDKGTRVADRVSAFKLLSPPMGKTPYMITARACALAPNGDSTRLNVARLLGSTSACERNT
jgi:hypothetical protein